MVNISDNIKEWDRNETIGITNTFRNQDGELYDPDSITLDIYDPRDALYGSVIIGTGEITKLSLGVWAYDFNIPDDAATGWWIVKWTALISPTQSDVTKSQFKVRDPERRLYTQPAYVYSRAGQNEDFVSEKDVNYFITEAMGEVDSLMGKVYDYSIRYTEWFDTTEPNKLRKLTRLFLRYTPIRSVVSVEEYDTNGDLTIIHTNDEYYIDLKTGMSGLHRKEFIHQMHRVKVVYNYGFDKVPDNIQQLTTVIAALKMLLNHIGSSVDDITSYSACGISLSVGEPYTASARAIELLVKEMQRIIAAIGRTKQSIFIG